MRLAFMLPPTRKLPPSKQPEAAAAAATTAPAAPVFAFDELPDSQSMCNAWSHAALRQVCTTYTEVLVKAATNDSSPNTANAASTATASGAAEASATVSLKPVAPPAAPKPAAPTGKHCANCLLSEAELLARAIASASTNTAAASNDTASAAAPASTDSSKPTAADVLRVCSRCKQVRYCSTACQAAHWKQEHKRTCKVSAS